MSDHGFEVNVHRDSDKPLIYREGELFRENKREAERHGRSDCIGTRRDYRRASR